MAVGGTYMNRPALALRVSGLLFTVIILGSILLFLGCNSLRIGSCVGETPVPKLGSVSPSTINTQTLPVTMTVTGSNFQTWSIVYWNGASLSTNYVDSHHLLVQITPETMTLVSINNGTALISVTTAGQIGGGIFGCDNGGSSSTFTIIIN